MMSQNRNEKYSCKGSELTWPKISLSINEGMQTITVQNAASGIENLYF
jgi:hypothetical protein